ncbi:phosphoglucosamine mutase [Acinetobacter haemolyticus]|uniref:Phosphoglucosamine mutase n=1 Tax=Acinetobacter haemolyticus TaxID=29430 RepID=A0A372MV99_ACIHA|nr:phosphoglucosamine mutase [Acinetobacter haemolyticus]ENW22101.1 phosphoglucosamine mutase [Acinetobacter haemolyticus NIPH 261]NAR52865.1 phosphoglucosamine mutase [Acinetobacter haemolyticus]NAR56154.1 phosphoglucosamine mutase [Acinetobacter haemolyticus]NAR59262.1 phosphoglucosamine mutase [Acinetobacter haemolyticus]NAR66115.1 phosphoglucosamine mutase [Acinetobacter haemolyticus]
MSYFGTDGIRGKFGQLPITPEFALKLGFAAGKVLKRNSPKNKPIVVLGKDTRLSGYILEAALQAGLNAAGVYVHLLGPLPTPAIAHLTRALHAHAGIVISASHNPYFDNGIKFFSSEGKKLPDNIQDQINQELEQDLLIDDTANLGKSVRVKDANGRYIEFCKSTFPYHFNLHNLKIVVDCANGAAYSVGPSVFRELGAKVIPLFNDPDGLNINENCGSTHPEHLQKAVVEHQADLGIAFDGDADRVVMVDKNGNLIDGDHILYILATQANHKPEGVVGTVMSNMALELALDKANVGFVRAKVGDRYVLQALEEQNWSIGGEPSGHILTLDKSTTGDAIIAALQVLTVMVEQGKALHELVDGFQLFPQVLVNVRLQQMIDPYSIPSLVEEFEKAEQQLKGRGRLLIRKSGTEPVIRVMVEGDDLPEVEALANRLADAVRAQAQVA